MAICLVCQGSNRVAVDDALMVGVSVRAVASQFNLSKSGVARHRAACLQPKLAAAARITAPAAEVRQGVERAKDIVSGNVIANHDDILSLTGLMARLARSLERLEGSADTAASQSLHTGLAAVSGQLHKAVEVAARLQGIGATPEGQASTALSITINVPTGQLPKPGVPAIVNITPQVPTMTLKMGPPAAADEPPAFNLPPMPRHLTVPDFQMTGDLVGAPLPPPPEG